MRICLTAGVSLVAVMVLSGCADVAPPRNDSAPGAASETPGTPGPVDLVGQGTVLQRENEPPQFCLGSVAESYPPQCTGPVLRGWNWSAVDQFESASGVTWGAYAVQGTWDGSEFTTTGNPIPLSLYDAMPFVDPRLAGGRMGDGDEEQLREIQTELHASATPDVLDSRTSDGYLIVTVPFDDGAIQERLDQQYGQNLILVQSALRPAP